MSTVYLPDLLSRQLSISVRVARIHLMCGTVRINNEVVTDFEVPAASVHGKQVAIGLHRSFIAESEPESNDA